LHLIDRKPQLWHRCSRLVERMQVLGFSPTRHFGRNKF
jgi:hypothetical protein